MLATLSGIIMLFNEVQFANAEEAMAVIPFERVTLDKEGQFWKVAMAISVTPSGTANSFNAMHDSKV